MNSMNKTMPDRSISNRLPPFAWLGFVAFLSLVSPAGGESVCCESSGEISRYFLSSGYQSPDTFVTYSDGTRPVPSEDQVLTPAGISGPIAPAATQPQGALSGRIVFTSGGHGWIYNNGWALQRGVLVDMNEDYGNHDQAAIFGYYCFNAGATVVPLRPIGHQTNEVVLDNTSAGVTYSGSWNDDTTEPVYYGQAGQVGFRWAVLSASETATATYTPNIPVAGFYPVYTWVRHGADRTDQLYRIRHTGGESQVRIPHHMVGNGWVYLGTYYFNAGSNSPSGSVAISNLQPLPLAGSVVIADAIRFGNGMSDSGSGYPREDEGARWWVKSSLGQGQPITLYSAPAETPDDEDRGARPRMAREMNREQSGNMFKRVYIGFHSNATTGNTNTATARGTMGLYNNNSLFPNSSTSNQFRLAWLIGNEVTTDMIGLNAQLEFPWHNRGSGITFASSSRVFREIDNNLLAGELDATIMEVAFHDNVMDGLLLRDPNVRNWAARASYQAVVRYMNEFDGAPLVFLPEPPTSVRALSSSNGVSISWSAPVSSGGSGSATGYVVYQSTNGYGFGNPVSVSGGATLSATLTNVPVGVDYYFRVAAVNSGGESMPSETVGCRRAQSPHSSRILFVNGFTRFDRTTNLRQTPTANNWQPPGNSGTIERTLPRHINAFDYVVQHGKAIATASAMPFDSCQRASVLNGQVSLTNYAIVIWAAGQEATNVLNSAAQSHLTAFRNGGGYLMLSGADVAWSLGRSAASSSDKAFLQNQLKVTLASDSHNNSQTRSFTAASGSIFSGKPSGACDDGTKGTYWVQFPDGLTPSGVGASSAMNYSGGLGGTAAVQHDGSGGGGKVVFLGFPFETITSASARTAYMDAILRFFSAAPRFGPVSIGAGNQFQATALVEPGYNYILQFSGDLTNWTVLTNFTSVTGEYPLVDSAGQSFRFYRVMRQ